MPVDRDGLKGDKGEDATGQLGKFYFYAGERETLILGSPEIKATATEAPYVYAASENKYYMWTGKVPYVIENTDLEEIDNTSKWTKIQYDQFSMADAMFANYAHLGSMIINRDWVISQYGSINGAQTGYKGYLSFDPIAFMTKIKGEASIGVITQVGTSASPKPNSQLFKVQRACTIYVKGGGTTTSSTTLVKLKSSYSNYFRFDNSPELPIDMYNPDTGVTRDVDNSSYTSFTVSSQNLGTYCFLNGNLSDIKVVCDNTNDVWIPNYALDLRAGFTYQNNAYVSGTITASKGNNSIKMDPNLPAIVGNNGSVDTFKVGFETVDSATRSYLQIQSDSAGAEVIKISSHQKDFITQSTMTGITAIQGSSAKATFGIKNEKIYITTNSWPKNDEVVYAGDVYLNSLGFLSVHGWEPGTSRNSTIQTITSDNTAISSTTGIALITGSGAITVTLPSTGNYNGKMIIVKKCTEDWGVVKYSSVKVGMVTEYSSQVFVYYNNSWY